MSVVVFVLLLTICSIATGIVTEVFKKLQSNFPTNILALIIGIAVGIIVTWLYLFYFSIPCTNQNIVSMILISILSGFGAMIGYDKVIQTVNQITKLGGK